ncbi:MAG: WD40 repeat domain-containing protein [Gemmataceae bacterium]
MKLRLSPLLAGVLLISVGQRNPGADPPPAPTYWQDVRPVLRKHCTVCHSAKNLREVDISGGLALDSYEAVAQSKRRALVKHGDGPGSKLVKVLLSTDADDRMPKGDKPLPTETIELVRRWIDAGAKEGTRPAVIDAPIVTNPGKRRKLDVRLETAAVPPAGTFGPAKPDKLTLVLKAGPLTPVTAVAFSPDGKRLASGRYGQVALWDLTTGKLERLLTSVLGAVNDVRFSPDGKMLAVAGGQPSAKGDLRLFQVEDGRLIGTLSGHDDVVFGVAFDRTGQKLVSASFDKTVRIWDVASRKEVQNYTGHSDFVYAVAFAPDGSWVVSASKDRTVKLIDAGNGKSRFTFSGMNEDVMAVAVSPDGKHVVSSGFDTGLYWWNPQTGERTQLQRGHGVAVHELSFSNDGKLVLSAAADRTVRLWDGSSGASKSSINVGSVVYAAAFRPDAKVIATGSFDGLVRLYDAASGRQLVTLLDLPADGDRHDWLVLAPEGYAAGSPGLASLGQWRMGNEAVTFEAAWKALGQADALAKAVSGQPVPAPTWK